jgi:hypothetical protein
VLNLRFGVLTWWKELVEFCSYKQTGMMHFRWEDGSLCNKFLKNWGTLLSQGAIKAKILLRVRHTPDTLQIFYQFFMTCLSYLWDRILRFDLVEVVVFPL